MRRYQVIVENGVDGTDEFVQRNYECGSYSVVGESGFLLMRDVIYGRGRFHVVAELLAPGGRYVVVDPDEVLPR
jgi:hypothetical protein